MEPREFLGPAEEFADRGCRLRCAGDPCGRDGCLVHYPLGSEVQKVYLCRFRFSLHDAGLDACPVLDEYVSEQQSRRRRCGHGGITVRHLHAGMVCVRPVPHDHCHRAALFSLCLSAHWGHPEKYGCHTGRKRHHSQGAAGYDHPTDYDPDRHAGDPVHLPADFFFRVFQLYGAGLPGVGSADVYTLHQDARTDPGGVSGAGIYYRLHFHCAGLPDPWDQSALYRKAEVFYHRHRQERTGFPCETSWGELADLHSFDHPHGIFRHYADGFLCAGIGDPPAGELFSLQHDAPFLDRYGRFRL